jgi:catalase (peroxidase I)
MNERSAQMKEKIMDPNSGEKSQGKCPVMHNSIAARSNRDWWPNQLNLRVLHQNSTLSNPMGAAFDYARGFQSLRIGTSAASSDRLLECLGLPSRAPPIARAVSEPAFS